MSISFTLAFKLNADGMSGNQRVREGKKDEGIRWSFTSTWFFAAVIRGL